MSENPFVYWDWEELKRFLLDHNLAIAEGLDNNDEFGLTGKGKELFDFLAMTVYLGGVAPR